MDLSVIIPAYNESEYIGQCCESLNDGLMYSGLSYEIIVIDNGSTDDTYKIVSGLGYVELFFIERASISCARNYGFKKSSGNILAFIDADVVVCRDWIRAVKSLFGESKRASILTGFQYSVRPNATWIESNWFSNISSSHINGGNIIISKLAFEYLGGFNEQLKTGEDVDICNRAEASELIEYKPDPGFKALHLGYPRTLKHFFAREMWHGEGDFLNLSFFIKSKVAIVSMFYGVISLVALFYFLQGSFGVGILLLLFLVLVNLLLTFYRFHGVGVKSIIFNSMLNYFYFMARFFSFFKSVVVKGRKY